MDLNNPENDLTITEDQKEEEVLIDNETWTNLANAGEIFGTKINWNKGLLKFRNQIVWKSTLYIITLHVLALYFFVKFDYLQNWKTTVWIFVMWFISGIGVMAGAHRYWAHRSYKAKWPLRIILMLSFCSAGQTTITRWVKYHRVHHKYVDTDADPHNSSRGFFFAHVGWYMLKSHPEVVRRAKEIDMSDIKADPIASFSDRHYVALQILCNFVLPTLVPVYFWNETWMRAFISQGIMRYVLSLNGTFSINSFAHLWGSKPYDASINPAENLFVSIAANGEGWHNYHHVFPWDYKAGEYGSYLLNFATMMIDMFHAIGWAYDLKQPSANLIKQVAMKRGDGSHREWGEIPAPKSKT